MCILSFFIPFKVIRYNIPSVLDHRIFPVKTIESGEGSESFNFVRTQEFRKPHPANWAIGKSTPSIAGFDEFLEGTNTIAFIVVKNDTILYEKYFNGYSREKRVLAFSLTKTFISTLVNIAISEGVIKSLNQKVSDFVPSFNLQGKENIEIQHLLGMTSGLNHDDYRKWLQTLKTYYDTDLTSLVMESRMEVEPGTQFIYKSLDYQILGMCIEKATGMSVTKYMQSRIWNKLGLEEALFTLDSKDGIERMFGGIALKPIDIIKFGKLYLDEGNWNGEQIFSSTWTEMIRTRNLSQIWWGYKYGWWRDTYIEESLHIDSDYFASGFNGQCLLVSPDLGLTILRLGLNTGGVTWHTSLSKLSKVISNINTTNVLSNPELVGTYLESTSNDIRIELSSTQEKFMWDFKIFGETDLRRTFKLTTYCGRSIYNSDAMIRLIFDYDDGKILGLSYDDSKGRLRYFKKLAMQ